MFEQIGFFREYHANGKFVGTINLSTYEGEIGYYSKTKGIAESNIFLQNKKVIKKGTEYYYFVYPLNGKLIK